MEYSNQKIRMLLNNIVYNGFEDFGNEPYILYDDVEDYDQNYFPDVNQNNDQDKEKMDVNFKHKYISSEELKQNKCLSIFSDQESI